MSRPLEGLLVVSLEQAIAAPYCTRLLADQGARVIKIERPDGGDFARGYDARARGLSSHFVWTNRSKESLALDVKAEGGTEILRSILLRADVFVQNLAPGAVTRLGLDPDDLRRANPSLLTCSISGYGPGGPMAGTKAYDLLIQAEAGFLSVTGTEAQMAKAGISVADIAAGVTAYHLILAALINRAKTSQGDHIEVSMLEAMAEWMGFPLNYAMDGAGAPRRTGAGHATIYPYGPFDTADGSIIFGIQSDRDWTAFATTVLKRPDIAGDLRFAGNQGRVDHRELLGPVIAGVLEGLTTAQAIRRLEEAKIGSARVNDMAQIWAHPQLAARDRWAEFGSPAGPLRGLKPASGDSWSPRFDPVPALGEQTKSILAEFAPRTSAKADPS